MCLTLTLISFFLRTNEWNNFEFFFSCFFLMCRVAEEFFFIYAKLRNFIESWLTNFVKFIREGFFEVERIKNLVSMRAYPNVADDNYLNFVVVFCFKSLLIIQKSILRKSNKSNRLKQVDKNKLKVANLGLVSCEHAI